MSGKISAETISKEDFNRLLDEYSALIKDISSAKPAKAGQKTLQQLDEYRYTNAVNTFSLPNPKRDMALDDVKGLVEWKLRHGKFRPTLMNLVSSNDASSAASTVQEAFKGYKSSSDIPAGLATLCKLRGIGPATASLLLSVYDPTKVLFFSDEAFWWLCCGGQKDTIKYNNKEYELLRSKAAKLVKRLGVEATDVEKVAYVVMKKDTTADTASAKPAPKSTPKTISKSVPKQSAKIIESKPPQSVKRKDADDEKEAEKPAGIRRSKRVKN